jgi:hypothetical protein
LLNFVKEALDEVARTIERQFAFALSPVAGCIVLDAAPAHCGAGGILALTAGGAVMRLF